MKKYLIIIPVLFLIYLGTLFLKKEEDKPKNSNTKEETKSQDIVSVFYENENFNMSLDDYVVNVLACEMPASFEMEALKAGSVAIRTFYLYKKNNNENYVASTTDQCYINGDKMKDKWSVNYEKYYNRIKEAVESTKNEVIMYKNNIIESFYFSMSNGYTENIETVFNESRPYLVSVDSSWDKNVNNFTMTIEMGINETLKKLGLECNNKFEYTINSRTSSNKVKEITINDVKFLGTDFRKKLSIRSTDFDIEVKDSKVFITTRGYGHGVGMSQYGANEMSKLGYSYKDILKYYYSGVEIAEI